MWSRRRFLLGTTAVGSILATSRLGAGAQGACPPFAVEGIFDLGFQGTLRSIRFAPERGAVPVLCLAALLPRVSFRASILAESDRARAYSAVTDLARRQRACVAINGGFFNFDRFTPEGLLVIDGKTVSRTRSDFSGAVSIDRMGALSVVRTSEVRHPEFAVQGRPLLVAPGGKMGMRSEDGRRAERSFIAQSGNIVIAAVTSPVTLYHLADVLVEYPDAFGLPRIDAALNLSGSATTSFYARLPDGTEVIRHPSWPNRDVLLFGTPAYTQPSVIYN
ncbi:MAG: phosphodiester glycosidase family protein [Firmicutes bacterium]|nr:phosphodiester glycosidase family protein [Bacillota bacterium]